MSSIIRSRKISSKKIDSHRYSNLYKLFNISNEIKYQINAALQIGEAPTINQITESNKFWNLNKKNGVNSDLSFYRDFCLCPILNPFGPQITFTRNSIGTRTNKLGIIETIAANLPRFDYDPLTKNCKGLLLEESRTNILLNSNTLSTQSVSVSATAHTLSFYGTGSITLSGASSAGPLTGTGDYPSRVTLTFTPSAGTLTLTVSGTVVFAQLEAGAFATSYIPTSGSSVTRAAETTQIVGSNFNALYFLSAGSIFTEASQIAAAGASGANMFVISDGTLSNRINQFFLTGNIRSDLVASGAAVFQFIIAGPSVGSVFKVMTAYQENDGAFILNGGAPATDTSFTLPLFNNINIGFITGANAPFNGHIRKIFFYTKRLSNSICQSLTT